MCLSYVTVHDKTNHIVLTITFELRRPLPTATFELLLQPKYLQWHKLKYTRIDRTLLFRKTQWNTIRSFTADFRILAIYAYMLATPTRWEGLMAAEHSNKSNDEHFKRKQKTSGVSKARYCTKSKKEVCGDLFVSSCRNCLPGNGSMSRLTVQLHGWVLHAISL